MSKKKLSKLLALYLPYVVIGLVATNLGEAWRLAAGKELGDKIVSLMDTLPAAFSNPLPSLHLFDLFIGLCCGAGMRLAVYLKGKNAKKYRHGMEYGSARWGTPKDIEPFMAPKFADNIILTKTERLMMSNRHRTPRMPGIKMCWWWAVPAAVRQGSLSSRICCNVIPRIFRYHSWLQIRKVVSAWNVEKPC